MRTFDAQSKAPRGLLGIQRFSVSRDVVERTEDHLLSAGAAGNEGLVLWAGQRTGRNVGVDTAIVPAQHAIRRETEVGVMVPGEELHRINVWLHRNERLLLAQVHSHPGAAYLSDTDEAFTVVAVVGGLSIIIPDFARRGLNLRDVAAYRLDADGHWAYVAAAELERLVELRA